jgi:anti-sigma factor RsiW
LKSLIGDLLDEEIAREVIAEVKAHLADCPSCHVEVDTLEKTIRIYRAASPCPAMKEDAKQRLYAVLSYEYRSTKRTSSS